MDHLEFVRRVKGGMLPRATGRNALSDGRAHVILLGRPGGSAKLCRDCDNAESSHADGRQGGEPESKSATTEVGPLRRVPAIW